ncbi:MAG: NAD(P)H-binding protein [Pseudomonadota bacterium]|jgi:divinyl chlorophyllide a 8-vinyl-reductase|nr:NAD(P)H-binding protein [Rubrivivax sp.]MCA3260062.1 NAD(P)H-binding protein [Rubrivivax sp.]MCZ8031096.1 NAD(P)H-binding protein [Rubrivivax sp.]
MPEPATADPPERVLLLGASGTIGRATLAELRARSHGVVCLVRPGGTARLGPLPEGVTVREADLTAANADSCREALRGERIDAVVSCMASRQGAPADAWAVEHRAQRHALQAARAQGARRFVLLSALCVQKPRLAFQHAKLAFERELAASGLDWTVVRATAFFKSLSGQVARVRAGRPYLVFGDGRLTACKPIADADLATYLVDCLHDPARSGCVLPLGGPGPAITPLEQAHALFELLGRPPRIRHVPVELMRGIAGTLGAAARLLPALPALEAKAEFARIGLYYATESMLVWDAVAGRYDPDLTPGFGTRTLREHYAALLRGEVADDRGAHAVF